MPPLIDDCPTVTPLLPGPSAHRPDRARALRPATASWVRARRDGAALFAAAVTAAVGLVVGTVPAVAALDPVAQAREQASASTAARQGAEARLAAASARRGELEQRTSELAGADAAATEQLAEAHRQVRELAVAAFIDGGRTKILQASLEPEEAAAVSWRVGMVAGGAGQVSESVDRYEQLQAQNDPEQQAVAQELDRTRAAEDQARSDVVQTSAAERDALVALDAAVAARTRAAAVAESTRRRSEAQQGAPSGAVVQGPTRAPRTAARSSSAAGLGVSSSGGGATAEEAAFLARVRQCEACRASGRGRSAVSADRGAGTPLSAPPFSRRASRLARVARGMTGRDRGTL